MNIPIKLERKFAGKQEYFWFANTLQRWVQIGEKIYPWVEYLGKIKKKNDGRYEWTTIDKRPFSSKKEGIYRQGVCDTMEAAMNKVEEAHNL